MNAREARQRERKIFGKKFGDLSAAVAQSRERPRCAAELESERITE